ncbi:MAG: FHA domain-containing protein [Verrucomicrobiota bacterium]|nr:FHA domain-containing protein [Verrucomicrobiota bacterium]
MLKLVLTWINKPWAFEVKPGLNKLGRNPTNDCRVSDASVSSFHCELLYENGVVSIRDLASTNGTFVDGQRVKDAVLISGQTLTLGAVSLRLEEGFVTDAFSPPPQETSSEDHTTMLSASFEKCHIHSTARAELRCGSCERLFCSACVTRMDAGRGEEIFMCPVCTGRCQLLHPQLSAEKENRSLIGRLTQSLGMRLK